VRAAAEALRPRATGDPAVAAAPPLPYGETSAAPRRPVSSSGHPTVVADVTWCSSNGNEGCTPPGHVNRGSRAGCSSGGNSQLATEQAAQELSRPWLLLTEDGVRPTSRVAPAELEDAALAAASTSEFTPATPAAAGPVAPEGPEGKVASPRTTAADTAVAEATGALPQAADAAGVVEASAMNLEQQLGRLEALLSACHLPDLDLDLELATLTELLLQQQPQQCSGFGGVTAFADAAANGSSFQPFPIRPPAREPVATSADVTPVKLAPVRTRVLRRTRVVRCPQVLVLQLMRTVWDPRVGAAVKDGRRVAFPLQLGQQELEQLGGAVGQQARREEEGTRGEQEEGQAGFPGKRPAPLLLSYTLMAVVVHYGGADSGHYLMYRRVGAAQPKLRQATAAGMDLPGGGSISNSCSSWLRVSDSSVALANEQEVLQQAAAMLLYELQ
jgi:hypothetical protein